MSSHFSRPLLAGMLSAGLFLLGSGLGLGFFFLFLPTLPILWVGLGTNSSAAFKTTMVAAGISAIAGGLPLAIVFLLFLALPAWFMAKQSLLSRSKSGSHEWFPIGLIFLDLTLYACVLMALVVLYYAGQHGSIEQALAQNMREEFAQMKAEYGDMLSILISKWAFLIFAMTIWLWALALYAHLWFATRVLDYQHKAIRPDVLFSVFSMPNWVLPLLLICALASLVGSAPLQFLGKSCLIALMLPYFFLGAAQMHAASHSWPSRRFFLFFVYFFIFAQFWPALILSGIGIWQHIKALSSGARSSKR